MVSRDNGNAFHFFDQNHQIADTLIHCFDRDNGRLHHSGMPDHITVREIEPSEFILTRPEQVHNGIRYLLRFHLRSLVKFNPVGRNLHICFKGFINVAGTVAIPEICHMAIFLSLGYGKRFYVFRAKVLADYTIDRRGLYKKIGRNVGIPVVLHHPGIENIRKGASVELGKFLLGKCPGNLYSAVTPEVEKDHGIAVLDRPPGHPRIISYDKRWQILIG